MHVLPLHHTQCLEVWHVTCACSTSPSHSLPRSLACDMQVVSFHHTHFHCLEVWHRLGTELSVCIFMACFLLVIYSPPLLHHPLAGQVWGLGMSQLEGSLKWNTIGAIIIEVSFERLGLELVPVHRKVTL